MTDSTDAGGEACLDQAQARREAREATFLARRFERFYKEEFRPLVDGLRENTALTREMSKSIQQMAGSVHELATSTKQLSLWEHRISTAERRLDGLAEHDGQIPRIWVELDRRAVILSKMQGGLLLLGILASGIGGWVLWKLQTLDHVAQGVARLDERTRAVEAAQARQSDTNVRLEQGLRGIQGGR